MGGTIAMDTQGDVTACLYHNYASMEIEFPLNIIFEYYN